MWPKTPFGSANPAYKHGGNGTRTHRTWTGMRARCTNPKHHNYKNYGGRGIKVCEAWLQAFETFLADMGERPPGTTLERKDTNGNYEPGNCKWATPKQQGRNRRDNRMETLNGVTKSLAEWCEGCAVPYGTVWERLKRGWSLERALTTPPGKQGKK